MQFADLLCYALLTIAVTATCVKGDEERQKQDLAENQPKRITKRNAAVLIDNFPFEPLNSHNPKVIFRRVSRQRYGGPPKPIYGPPRPKYGPPTKNRKPSKNRKPTRKYRKQLSPKYGPGNKKRTPKPQYGPPKRPFSKPVYGPPRKPSTPEYYTPEPAGFAEPPNVFDSHYVPTKQGYAEPPVDSYGAPLKTTKEPYPTAPSHIEANPNHYNQNEFSSFDQEYHPWQNYQQESNVDNSYAHSNKKPIFVKPDELFDTKLHQGEEDFHSDIHNYKEPQYLHNRKKKPLFFADSNKKVNKYWKAPRFRPETVKVEPDDEVLVGGQYAEPPARYVPKFQPSAPMYNGADEFAPPHSFRDSDGAVTSAPVSPYVNYKNSNMAFSPQNLNDAFSIVDK